MKHRSSSSREGVERLAIGAVLVMLAGCAGSQESAARTADDEEGAVNDTAGGGGAEVVEQPTSYLDSPICAAYESSEVDPLHRWIQAWPVESGGAVMVFTGSTADQMDVEAALEMAAIAGYMVQICGTAVVVWVPGLDCDEQQAPLITRVEEGTMMTHQETTCFRIDEVRTRLAEECGRGSLPADRCP